MSAAVRRHPGCRPRRTPSPARRSQIPTGRCAEPLPPRPPDAISGQRRWPAAQRARSEGAGGRMVIGRPPQSHVEMTRAVALGASRELKWTGTAGTHFVLRDAPRIHHETTTRSLRALSRQTRRSVGVSVEPEEGFEPPTCRLRGHRSPATMRKAGRVAQLRRADRQGRNDSVKGGTLAETLAQQSRHSGTLRRLRRHRGCGGGAGRSVPANADSRAVSLTSVVLLVLEAECASAPPGDGDAGDGRLA
jgi:hypothetical protein